MTAVLLIVKNWFIAYSDYILFLNILHCIYILDFESILELVLIINS